MIEGDDTPINVPDSHNMVDGANVGSLVSYSKNDVLDIAQNRAQNALAVNTIGKGLPGFFADLVGNIGGAIVSGLSGVIGGVASWLLPVARPAKSIKDGQTALNDEVELISPLLDYGAVSTPPGRGNAMTGSGRIPFNFKIGAMEGVHIEDNTLVLEDIGVWDLRGQVTAAGTFFTGEPMKVWLRVLKPDGRTVHSQQAHFASTMNAITIPIVTCVMVKEPGYRVDMYVWARDGGRGWWRGPEWTRLVVQHISRSIDEGGTGGETSAEATPDPPSDGGVESQPDTPTDI